MAPRRASARGCISTLATRGRAPGGVRKNTRPGQAPNRYGQQLDPQHSIPVEDTNEPSSSSQDPKPSTPQYSDSPASNERIHVGHSLYSNTMSAPQMTPVQPSEIDSHTLSRSPSDIPINLSIMGELLHSHEQEIVDRVILQLTSQNPNPQHPNLHTSSSSHPQPVHNPIQATPPPKTNATLARITELESQLAQLQKESEQQQTLLREPQSVGKFDPAQLSILEDLESVPGTMELVEV